MQSRREFVKKTGILTTGICCSAGILSLLESCSSTKSIAGIIEGNVIKLNVSDFGESKFLVIRNDKLSAPIYLTKIDEKYKAFLMLCTHKQCELKASGQVMICPCHGSEFSNEGVVLSAPAEENLKEYKVILNKEEIKIDLK
mgnify:CR=1 FL=1